MNLRDAIFHAIFREQTIYVGKTKVRLVGEMHIVPPGLRSRIERYVSTSPVLAVEGIDKNAFPERLLVYVYAPLKILVHLGLLGGGAIMTSMRLAKEGKVRLHKLEEGHRPGAREKFEIGMLAALTLLSYFEIALAFIAIDPEHVPLVLVVGHLLGLICLLELVIFMVAWPVFERTPLLRAIWWMGPGILFARNEVMIRRLRQLIDEGAIGDEVMVIVGRAHLPHLVKRLAETEEVPAPKNMEALTIL